MHKKILSALLIGFSAGILALFFWFVGILDGFENSTWTYRVNILSTPSPYTPKIKIIAIDQASLEWMLNQDSELSWPWPRQAYSPILSFLSRAKAKAVIFDIIFEQPSVGGLGNDKLFAKSIAKGPPFVGVVSLCSNGGTSKWAKWTHGINISGMQEWEKKNNIDINFSNARFPIPLLGKKMTILGNVIDKSDKDGIIRRIHLFRKFDGMAVPSLSMAAYLAANPTNCKIDNKSNTLKVGKNKSVILGKSSAAILRFRGAKGTHDKISAAAVIQSEIRIQQNEKPVIAPDFFKDCYVFFIPTAAGTYDLKSTPVGSQYPGGEVHATALDNLLNNDFIRATPNWLVIISTLSIAILIAGIVFLSSEGWLAGIMIFALALPIGIGLSTYEIGLWWPVVPLFMAIVGAAGGVMILKYITEGRERRFIRTAFQHYLSPEVINKITKDPSNLKLGGERRELSIFFSDLQGFTSISENLDPVELTQLLNDYLSDMTDIILDSGGTLDKYEGDAIIAFWNAPLDQKDHAVRAVKAAIQCQAKLAERREEFKKRTGHTMMMRIGINTGEVVVGNLGSRRRFDYTVLGDAVNLAARLEGANKALDTYTMVSATTWQQAVEICPELMARELGFLQVVGRAQAVKVFEPLGESKELEKSQIEKIEIFAKGLELIKHKKWQKALTEFIKLKDDPPSLKYIKKCQDLIEDNNSDWNGVWSLLNK